MAKVDYLVASFLLIPSNVGLVNDLKRWRRICNVFQPMESKSLLPWPIISQKCRPNTGGERDQVEWGSN